MDHQRFSNILSGVQSIVLSVAVVVGGVWTLVSINYLKQKDLAEQQLRDLQTRLTRRGLQISLTADVLRSQGRFPRYISVLVTLTNDGLEDETLDLSSESPLSIFPVSISQGGEHVLGRQIRNVFGTVGRPIRSFAASDLLPDLAKRVVAVGSEKSKVRMKAVLDSQVTMADLEELLRDLEQDAGVAQSVQVSRLRTFLLESRVAQIRLRSGTSQTLSFVGTVAAPGVYLVQFFARSDRDAPLDPKQPVVHGAQQYVVTE